MLYSCSLYPSGNSGRQRVKLGVTCGGNRRWYATALSYIVNSLAEQMSLSDVWNSCWSREILTTRGNTSSPFHTLQCLVSAVDHTMIRSSIIVAVMIFFNQTQDLRAPSADRLEILHSDQHMRQFFNASPKIRGSSPKIFYPAKFSVDFTQLPTLIANISGTRQDIKIRKDMWSRAIPPAFSQPSPVNFGPLSTEYVVHVSLDLAKSTFFDRLYFGP